MRRGRVAKRLLHRDVAPLDGGVETLIERLHAVVLAGADGLGELSGHARVDDHLAHAVCHREDLGDRDAATAVGRRHEPLRDDALQRARDQRAHLLLLTLAEEVEQAVDLGSVDRVDRRQHEVPGLRR